MEQIIEVGSHLRWRYLRWNHEIASQYLLALRKAIDTPLVAIANDLQLKTAIHVEPHDPAPAMAIFMPAVYFRKKAIRRR